LKVFHPIAAFNKIQEERNRCAYGNRGGGTEKYFTDAEKLREQVSQVSIASSKLVPPAVVPGTMISQEPPTLLKLPCRPRLRPIATTHRPYIFPTAPTITPSSNPVSFLQGIYPLMVPTLTPCDKALLPFQDYRFRHQHPHTYRPMQRKPTDHLDMLKQWS